ncbi:MAG TPA: putative selenate reductase subunit YgfK [Spirochaetia bacterium]|nr:putative selenate reductase subunit YgfK [Spirochaetaceae bacterium]HRW24014.1 putative selenate reductase subunit YgfK [Spirochaetia bacterium]
MSKIMKSMPMRELMARVVGEWTERDSAYDIPGATVRRVLELEAGSPGFKVNGTAIGLPVGPAAGPHTQIAANIVAAWLAGARVFELKTVQENDRLDIEKPCIDALDEGHNVEWSTELLLEEARAEYLNAWIAIHVLRAALCEKPGEIMFNMSVGYTLDGIKGERVNAFIEGMRKPAGTPIWETALAEAKAAVGSPSFAAAFGEAGAERAGLVVNAMPSAPVHSVTLSTMHGCPPAEIERIGAYLIEEKGFDTYVKLNPTLLGYDEVRGILDATGWQRIGLKRPTFEHDLQFDAALALIASLRAKAKAKGVRFGVKLSNTLANVNDGKRMPGGERYMSGRALFPITARLAARLAAALPEPLPFSYCGGVSAHNAYDCMQAGLGPLTVATDILKPGGYLRLEPMAREAVRSLAAGVPAAPDAARLDALAKAALTDAAYRGDAKKGEAVIKKKLPQSDCFAAPCVEACPASQKPPAYMKALAAGDAEKALRIILADNPLPHVTGVLCDHQCMYACSRVDYEGSVEIRSMKLACARAATVPAVKKPAISDKGKTAVFGAGPAGLACAHYLALEGYPVTVFDTSSGPGGVPANVIPRFRISRDDIAADIERIKALGAKFVFGHSGKIDRAALESEGFSSILIATGSPVPRELPLEGSGVRVVDALEFLAAAHEGSKEFDGFRSVAVVGGGNTAMDAARVASRLPGKPKVAILYRRSLAEMPADREEFEAALADGVEYAELSLPESASPASGSAPSALLVREMELGEPDASGRRAPVPSPRTRTVPCDLVIAAVGESPDKALFESLGAKVERNGRPAVDPETMATGVAGLYAAGDSRRGPASIIAAEADGRKAAYAILRAVGVEPGVETIAPGPIDREALSRRGEILPSLPEGHPDFAKREAERCLSCGSACLRCVEVCPNRANVALPVAPGAVFKQAIQVVHVDDFCNECGNCGFFCPYDGEPYTGKPTLFRDEASLRASANAGFAFAGPAASPTLVLRAATGADAAVTLVPFAEWRGRAAAEALPALAAEILDSHAYLIAGGKA